MPMSKKKHIQEYIKNRFLEINQLQKQVHIYTESIKKYCTLFQETKSITWLMKMLKVHHFEFTLSVVLLLETFSSFVSGTNRCSVTFIMIFSLSWNCILLSGVLNLGNNQNHGALFGKKGDLLNLCNAMFCYKSLN